MSKEGSQTIYFLKKYRKTIIKIVISIILISYSIITIIPFYFLFVRSFVPTSMTSELHLWIPKTEDFNLDSEYGNMSVFLSLNTEQFKEEMGINGYLSPNMTFRQISEEYNIPEEKISKYMNPFYKYNGWFVVFKSSQHMRSLFITILITIISIFLGAFISIATGSVLAGFKKRWHMFIYNLYLIQIIIPPVMIMLSLYLIVKFLHLTFTYTALILLFTQGGALSTMLFTSYIATIPKELKESVNIDGGNRFHYFFSILLPLCKIPFGSYLAIVLPWFWNDLLYGILFLRQDQYTFVPLLNLMQGKYSTNLQAMYAALCISIMPILVIYLIFQKFFVNAQLAGAVKG